MQIVNRSSDDNSMLMDYCYIHIPWYLHGTSENTLGYPVLFCFVLFCFVLFCFVLFCFVFFVLFCFVLFLDGRICIRTQWEKS